MRLARGRVDRQRRAAEAVVRAVHAALGRGLSALLNCHGSFLQQICATFCNGLCSAGGSSRCSTFCRCPRRRRCRLVALTDRVQRHQRQRQQCLLLRQPAQIEVRGVGDAPARSRPALRRSPPAPGAPGTARRAAPPPAARSAGSASATVPRNVAVDRRPVVEQRKPEPHIDPRSVQRARLCEARQAAPRKNDARWCCPPARRRLRRQTSRWRRPGVAAWGAYTSGHPLQCQKQ